VGKRVTIQRTVGKTYVNDSMFDNNKTGVAPRQANTSLTGLGIVAYC
jgi:hypothetical protein